MAQPPKHRILTKQNWHRAVVEAIEGLPSDIQASVGYAIASDMLVNVKVAVEPDDPVEVWDVQVNDIEVRWWNSRREQLRTLIDEFPGIGLEPFYELEESCGLLDRPSCAVDGSRATGDAIWSMFPGTATVRDFMRLVQLTILEQLWCGCGLSMVVQDGKGRFTRQDGSHILEWQWRKPRRR
jgi:hypothetical protein